MPQKTRAAEFEPFEQLPYPSTPPRSAGAAGAFAGGESTAKKHVPPKSGSPDYGKPPRPSVRPPGGRHWWRGRPSQQFVGKGTFRAPRTGVLDRFGPLERELARPQTRAPATRALRADLCLNRRSSQVYTRTNSRALTKNTLNNLSTSNHGQERFASAPRKRGFCRMRPRVRGQHR